MGSVGVWQILGLSVYIVGYFGVWVRGALQAISYIRTCGWEVYKTKSTPRKRYMQSFRGFYVWFGRHNLPIT